VEAAVGKSRKDAMHDRWKIGIPYGLRGVSCDQYSTPCHHLQPAIRDHLVLLDIQQPLAKAQRITLDGYAPESIRFREEVAFRIVCSLFISHATKNGGWVHRLNCVRSQ